jgi:hypothetical protein
VSTTGGGDDNISRVTASPPSDATEAQLAAIDQMHRQFTTNGIEYWLFGGWAVDFHAGRVTRAHSDIDLAVWRADVDRIAARLEAEGWQRAGESVDGAMTYQRGAVQAEIAFLARDENDIVYTPVDGGRGEWPPHAFGAEIAVVAGVHARVIELAALIEEKSAGYGDAQAHAKDRIDLAVLTDTGGRPAEE